ncbi:MAG: polysaccharide deacetylase family protein [Burkholderiaceae bacterium]
MSARDLRVYGRSVPDVRWPGGAGLAVSLVLNIEEGAELSVADGDERNETVHEVEQPVSGVPDLCLASHFEYGSRAGYWRIARVLEEVRVPVTLNACARAVQATPWLARDAIARGHEIACHGWRWESHAGMEEAHERALIARAHAVIREVCGVAPRGWHTKSSPSVNTRRLLVEHGGFDYDSDAYNDDLPYYVTVGARPHLVLPYAFDTNDMRFFGHHAFVRGADFADYVLDGFKELLRESRHQPRMISIGLHLRIIGRAARIGGLRRLLQVMREHEGVWFATRAQIADHWRARVGP